MNHEVTKSVFAQTEIFLILRNKPKTRINADALFRFWRQHSQQAPRRHCPQLKSIQGSLGGFIYFPNNQIIQFFDVNGIYFLCNDVILRTNSVGTIKKPNER